MKQRLIINIFLGISLFSVYSFKWVEAEKDLVAKQLEAMSAHLKALKGYSVQLSYASFVDYNTPISYEKTNGYLKVESTRFHSYVFGIHTLQNERCRIVLDSIHRTIAITDPMQSVNYVYELSNYRKVLDICQSIKLTTVKTSTLYRFEFPSNYPLSAYELLINSEKMPEKITMFYDKALKKNPKDIATKPRMEITFTNWIKNPTLNKQEFDEKEYVYKKDNNFILNSPYSTLFKLLDQRVATK